MRITANGETKTRDFNVTIDPRLVADGITEADLLEQFKLSVRVRDKVSEANQAVIDIRSLREQINQRLQKVSARRKDEIQKLADAVLVPLTAVEEEAYQVRNRSGQDPLNYPIKLNNKIAALAGVIESADNKPTDQSVEVFNELSRAARRAAGEDEGDAVQAAAAAERRLEAREAGRRRSEGEAGAGGASRSREAAA